MRRYIIMQGPKSPIAVGSTEVQQVEPIPSEPTGNFSNSVGWHESTFGRTTAKMLLLSGCWGSRHLTSHRAVFSTWTLWKSHRDGDVHTVAAHTSEPSLSTWQFFRFHARPEFTFRWGQWRKNHPVMVDQ